MNLKKMSQRQTKKIVDALANHPEKKKSEKNEVNLERIAETLTERKFGKSKTSEDEKSDEE
jgi:ribosomal protein L18E